MNAGRDRQREKREQRTVMAVLAILLVSTLLVSPLAFGQLGLLALLAVPFALTLLVSVAVPPLVADPVVARAERAAAVELKQERSLAAGRHAVIAPRTPASLADDRDALSAAMVKAEADYGIHFACAHLRDGEFLQAFHANDLRANQFRHGDHLRYAFLMLRRVPAGLAAETISGNLRGFLRVVCGSETLFHATRTHAWVAILQAFPERTFSKALAAHAEEITGAALERYYSPQLLASAEARQRFVLPDREPLPVAVPRVPLVPAAQAPMASRT